MRLTRILTAGTAALALSFMAGCSDDGDAPADDAPASQAEQGSPPADAKPSKDRSCRAEIEVTGAVQAAWQGPASSRTTSGNGAVYTAEKGGSTLTLYSETDDYGSSVNFRGNGAQYATLAGEATGLDIARSGKAASASTDVEAEGKEPIHVEASFTCAKG
jgi:hypothetical protein